MTASPLGVLLSFGLLSACATEPAEAPRRAGDPGETPGVRGAVGSGREATLAAAGEAVAVDGFEARRLRMVERDIAARGVTDAAVLRAMRTVPRHRFVPAALEDLAYADRPLPIGEGQTISQPYIVALMTELAHVGPDDRVLEVGTGSGYQAAVLAQIAREVFTIEILAPLAAQAGARLRELGYENLRTRVGDGYRGWPEAAPFDAIVVTAAPPDVPPPLLDQLALGGRLVLPVGAGDQELVVVERTAGGFVRHRSIPVRFVPMTGAAQQ
jgi:protein-L-isoaspartate(D-aspartate) O-methyltransferase